MLQGSSSQTLLLPAKPTINKEQEIIVRLNDQNQKAILKEVPTDIVRKDLNVRIESLGYHPIRAVKRLPSGDIAVLTTNNDETKKLRNDDRWTSVLGSDARMVTRTYGIMINEVRVSEFDMGEKEKMIQHIKESNKDIERLQGMDIKWIEWRSMPKIGQELASLVIEFSTPEHANAALDCNILLGREVFGGVVFNRLCKSIQCFRCYSYGHITVQCTDKAACGHCSQEHSSKDCPGNLPQKCVLCKGNHKAWDKACPHKKAEMERIAKALAQTPYRYPTNGKDQRADGDLSQDDPFAEDEMGTQVPIEEPPRLLPGKRRLPTKFLAAGGPPVPNLSRRQCPRSRSRSPTSENRANAVSPRKSLATSRPSSDKIPNQGQTARAALGPRDPNAVSTRSMRNLESSQSSAC